MASAKGYRVLYLVGMDSSQIPRGACGVARNGKGSAMESRTEELARLRRTLAAHHHETPEHRAILDRIAVLVRLAAVARRKGN